MGIIEKGINIIFCLLIRALAINKIQNTKEEAEEKMRLSATFALLIFGALELANAGKTINFIFNI